jgi:hypothetical protein
MGLMPYVGPVLVVFILVTALGTMVRGGRR